MNEMKCGVNVNEIGLPGDTSHSYMIWKKEILNFGTSNVYNIWQRLISDVHKSKNIIDKIYSFQ